METWRGVIAELEELGHPRDRLAIGGKSLGGRIATMVAADQGIAAVVCLGYPFHPPGRSELTRIAPLETIKTPTLICQGERDPFGSFEEVTGCYQLSPMVQLHWLADGDHSFRPRKRSGLREAQNWDSAMDAIRSFLVNLG
jgi:predicted alpha/beta-hydrolase family hydrolase